MIIIIFMLALLFSGFSHAETMLCGTDINSNGEVEKGELNSCYGTNNDICPLGAVACNWQDELFTYEPEIKCPEEYTHNQSSTFCEKTNISDYFLKCDAGYLLVDGRCKKTDSQSVIIECPTGYNLQGSQCVRNSVVGNVQLSCPSGGALSGSICSRTQEQCLYQLGYAASTIGGKGYLLSWGGVVKLGGEHGRYGWYPHPDGSSYKYGGWIKNVSYVGHYAACRRWNETYTAVTACPHGGVVSGNQCVQTSILPVSKSCPAGYIQSDGHCYKETWDDPARACRDGYTLEGNKCEQFLSEKPNYLCPTGSKYIEESKRCEQTKAVSVCPTDNNLACSNDGQGNMFCSPNQCVDADDPSNTIGNIIDGTMLVNDGEKDEGGTCLEQLYIYNGRGQYCKTPGLESAWQNCCKNKGQILQDGAGGYGEAQLAMTAISTIYEAASAAYVAYDTAMAAGQTAEAASSAAAAAGADSLMAAFDPTSLAIAVAMHLVMEWINNACSQEELETAMAVGSGYCHFVGEYCKQEIKFIGCVQKAKSYCCFNSKLARIIHEGGRPQLTTFGTWGTPERPSCRGFTPEEFQSIDFSKIDMTEYVDELKKNVQAQVEQNLTEISQDFFDKVK